MLLPTITEDFAFDIESMAPKPYADIIGIGISTATEDHYIPFISFNGEETVSPSTYTPWIKDLFSSPYNKMAHNVAFDASILKYHGINGTNYKCTEIFSWMKNNNFTKNLSEVTERELGYSIRKFKEFSKHKDWAVDKPSVKSTAKYCTEHSRATYDIYNKLLSECKPATYDLYNREMDVVDYIVKMVTRGFTIDIARLLELKKQYEDKMDEYEQQILSYPQVPEGFNVNSGDQIAELLFNKMGYAGDKLTGSKKRYSVDEEALTKLSGKFPKLIMDYREYKKLSSTVVNGLFKAIYKGRAYTSFDQVGTKTGRLSSSDPNFQNVPIREHPEIRSIFIASPGMKLIGADYNQIEIRLLAHFCQDPNLLKAIHSGEDIHVATAKMMFNDYEANPIKRRYQAKTINFGLIYGMSAETLASMLGCYVSEARALMRRYFQEFPTLKTWIDELIEETKQNGYLTTLSGEVRLFPEYDYGIGNAHTDRKVVDYKIQGSAADICKEAMININDAKIHPLLQVHDELVSEALTNDISSAMVYIKEEMERDIWDLSVPLTVDINSGDNWEELK